VNQRGTGGGGHEKGKEIPAPLPDDLVQQVPGHARQHETRQPVDREQQEAERQPALACGEQSPGIAQDHPDRRRFFLLLVVVCGQLSAAPRVGTGEPGGNASAEKAGARHQAAPAGRGKCS